MSGLAPPYAIIAKPAGPQCNLACRYCFYLEKVRLNPRPAPRRMPPPVLESFIRQYIRAQDFPEVSFAWQGGEPTLLGVDFFAQVVALQARYAQGKKISNSLQTNGVLLDDRWGEFLARHDFLVGLSLDGPPHMHDVFRRDPRGGPTFERVMRGLGFLNKHGVSFNLLTVLSQANLAHPLELYDFLRQAGQGHMQFIPLVERLPEGPARERGLDWSPPPGEEAGPPGRVSPWSARPDQLAEFYIQVFDHWVRRDVGRMFVQFFEVALGNWLGRGSGLCQFAATCGHAGVLEANGDLYSCDHYVYPRYRLGNILQTPLARMMVSPTQRAFGLAKRDTLPRACGECPVAFACGGGCPKHRFVPSPGEEAGQSYLCPAYRRVFAHLDPYCRAMAQLWRSGREVAGIMDLVRRADAQPLGPDDPCPCGGDKI
ncbi:MAG: anaerobic sulfatase maturase [Desulfarculus sp.]|nr:anaerobic sulfatase maturase [Pseudomonadota bacterium]MBU4576474.1 anaerobic sulfatase maturase [Pseudomonadota bacterium]MBU4596545.1 anaerobic sulfatase maturase [Pseudomonadota bacterium]MBV1716770.1 anaerobic sulfatase maturase [Desulfarculus sp.]MBV1738953.1 anaerobic sulfatase maturase [Desulfarculus sp.]